MVERAAAKALDEVSEEIELAYVTSSAPTARHALVDSLSGHDVDPAVVDESAVVVSELVTNAVQHSTSRPGDTITVAWTLRKGVVEVAVTDAGGPTSPMPVRRNVLASSGRGLRIVRSFAHEWGVLEQGRSRTVWAALGGPSRRRTR